MTTVYHDHEDDAAQRQYTTKTGKSLDDYKKETFGSIAKFEAQDPAVRGFMVDTWTNKISDSPVVEPTIENIEIVDEFETRLAARAAETANAKRELIKAYLAKPLKDILAEQYVKKNSVNVKIDGLRKAREIAGTSAANVAGWLYEVEEYTVEEEYEGANGETKTRSTKKYRKTDKTIKGYEDVQKALLALKS